MDNSGKPLLARQPRAQQLGYVLFVTIGLMLSRSEAAYPALRTEQVSTSSSPAPNELAARWYRVIRPRSSSAMAELAYSWSSGRDDARTDVLVRCPDGHRFVLTTKLAARLGIVTISTKLVDEESGFWVESRLSGDFGVKSIEEMTVAKVKKAVEQKTPMTVEIRTSAGGFASVEEDYDTPSHENFPEAALREALAGEGAVADSVRNATTFLDQVLCQLATSEIDPENCGFAAALSRSFEKLHTESPGLASYNAEDWEASDVVPNVGPERKDSPFTRFVETFRTVRWDGKRISDRE